ncbi:MAG: M67 family metallopeptidase [Crocinitomicaceae bacterium]|nr:M67 family metallopeptidase [Crocinitomicaceae bacterium]
MLFLSSAAKNKIISEAILSSPDECCGFLFGREYNEHRTITEVCPVANAKEGDKKRKYEIFPVDYLKAEKYAETNGLDLLGIYHSHPNHPSVPSEHDRVAAQPYCSYIIISVTDGAFNTIQSWRLNEDFQFEEETIAITETQ